MGNAFIKTTTESFQMRYLLYANLSQSASKLPEVKDLEIRIYLIKMDFMEILTLTSSSFDAP